MGEYHEIPGVMRARVDTLATPVQVRDGWVPPEIDVKLRSVGTQPAVSLKIEVRQGIPVCTEVKAARRRARRYGGRASRRSRRQPVGTSPALDLQQAPRLASSPIWGTTARVRSRHRHRRIAATRAGQRSDGRAADRSAAMLHKWPTSIADIPTGAAGAGGLRGARISERTAARYVDKCRRRDASRPRGKGIGEMSRRIQLPPQIRKITVNDRGTGQNRCAVPGYGGRGPQPRDR